MAIGLSMSSHIRTMKELALAYKNYDILCANVERIRIERALLPDSLILIAVS